MAITKALGTTGNGVGVVTPIDHKMAQSALFVKTSTANLIRPGVLYNGTASLVAGRANMAYDVLPFTAALTRGATAGTVILSNDGTVTVNTTAAPGSNSRIDVIYVWAREFSIDGVDSNPVIGVVQGTAAASPTVPSLAAFPGAIELARVIVPAGVTATNSGTTFTQTAPFTSVDGSPVAFRNTTEMNLWTNALVDQQARDLSSGSTFRWSGSAWVGAGGGLVPVIPTSVVGATLTPAGRVTFTGSASVSVNGVFTTAYDNYKVIFDVTVRTSAVDGVFRFRAGGVDASAALYAYERGFDSGTSRTVTSVNPGGSALCDIGGGICTSEMLITNPALATTTRAIIASVGTSASAQIGIWHNVASAHDGFTISVPSGAITGTIRVYGYNNL